MANHAKHRTLGLIALSASACLALSSCGSTTPAESAPPAAANYTFAIAQDFQGVDRASYSSEAAKTLADIQQSRLLNLSKDDSSATTCQADTPTKIDDNSPLVEKWKTTPDGKALSMTLRADVKSAAGNTLTSGDVAWTIDRIKAVDAGAQTLWFKVGHIDPANPITVIDETHFTINLTNPSLLAPYALAGVAGMIYDSADAKQHATAEDPWAKVYLKDHTANFGPWNLSTFSAQQLIFSKNNNYAAARGNLESVTVQTVADASARIQLVQSGQASETNGLDYTQLEQLAGSKSITQVNCSTPARDWLGLNAADPVLGKAEVRQAISLALDREAISKSVYRGIAKASTHGLSYAFEPNDGSTNYESNQTKAKELLASAGYADGIDINLSVSPAQPGPYSQNLAALLQQQLSAIGIRVKITSVPSATDFRAQGLAHSMQAWLMSETPAFANAGYSAWLTAGTTGLQNYMGYSNPTLDALADQLMTSDSGDATAALNQLSDLIDAEQPAVYLADRTSPQVRANCVTSVPTSAFAFDLAKAVSTCG